LHDLTVADAYNKTEVIETRTAKIFSYDNYQAVRLPKEYRFSGSEVYILKVGYAVMLFPKENAWETFLNGLYSFTDDFFENGRSHGDVQAPSEKQQ
jgi:antitoxin VapB